MPANLNLIKTNLNEVERRILPRFPFTTLTFKDLQEETTHAYEVTDISHTGMQLALKEGNSEFNLGETLRGCLHWKKARLNIEGDIKWVKGGRLGVAFKNIPEMDMKGFLSVSNVISSMKPLHHGNFEMSWPHNLKYWLMSDGPVELFIWKQSDGDLGRFQFIIFDSYIEWDYEDGIKTGKVLTKRDLETPLMSSDEMVFKRDEVQSKEKIDYATRIIVEVPFNFLPKEACLFIKEKLAQA